MKKSKFVPVGTGILLEWIKSDSKLILSPEIRQMMEMDANRTPKVIAVGPQCKEVKEGKYVLLNSGGKLLEFNGMTVGFCKEHQVDIIYDEKPEFQTTPLMSNGSGEIKTEKTEKRIIESNNKYNIH